MIPARLARSAGSSRRPTARCSRTPSGSPKCSRGLPEDVRAIAQANLDAGNAYAPDLGPPLSRSRTGRSSSRKPVDQLRRLLQGGGGEHRHPVAVLRRDPLRGDQDRPHPRQQHRRRAGPDAVHPEHLGRLRRGRHQRRPRRHPGRGRYLSAAGGPGNMDKAIFAYNHSDAYVTAIQRYAGVIIADARAFAGYHRGRCTSVRSPARPTCPRGGPH